MTKDLNDKEYLELISKYSKGLVDEQLRLEEEGQFLGYNRFMKSINRAKADGDMTSVGTTQTFLKELMPVYIAKIQAWLDAANTGKPGKRHVVCGLIKTLSVSDIAFIAAKEILAKSLKTIEIPVVTMAEHIGKAIEAEIRYQRVLESMTDKERGAFLEGLSKRVGLSYKRAYVQAKERYLQDEGNIKVWEKYSTTDILRIGIQLLEIFCNSTGLGYFVTDSTSIKTGYTFRLDEDVLKYIDYQDEILASLSVVTQPTVIPPKPWTDVFNGGYYLQLKRPTRLIRAGYNTIIKQYKDVDMPNVYKAVNAIQNTAWQINPRVLEVVNAVAKWKNINPNLGIPSEEPAEKPIRPAEADENEEVQKAWRKAMVKYYQQENTRVGKRCLINRLLAEANKFAKYDEIYFPHNLDFRGRVYPMTILNPQSNDLGKSLIQFANGVALGSTGARWLAFQGANCYGLDKKTMTERLEWVYSNTELILATAKRPLDDLRWMDADSPFEFLAFCFEWADYMEQGERYVSKLPIAFDGSCSGIQHFSAMLRDEVGGLSVNLVPDDKVHDIYGIVCEKIVEVLKKDFDNGSQDEVVTDDEGKTYIKKGTRSLAKEWLDYGMSRKVPKRSVMTLPYGSGQYGFVDQVYEDTVALAIARNPMAFSAPRQACSYMAKLIWDAVHKVVIKAMEAMKWLQTASALLASDKNINGESIPTYWITPAGFPVLQKYLDTKDVHIKTVLSGSLKIQELLTKEITEKTEGQNLRLTGLVRDQKKINVRKQRQGIAPNFVHSMDASHLMLTVCACADKGIKSFAMIHDSYGCPAGQADIMFTTVREVFVDTYKNNDVLQDLHDHVANLLSRSKAEKLPPVPSKGNLDLDLVKQSLYAFA